MIDDSRVSEDTRKLVDKINLYINSQVEEKLEGIYRIAQTEIIDEVLEVLEKAGNELNACPSVASQARTLIAKLKKIKGDG